MMVNVTFHPHETEKQELLEIIAAGKKGHVNDMICQPPLHLIATSACFSSSIISHSSAAPRHNNTEEAENKTVRLISAPQFVRPLCPVASSFIPSASLILRSLVAA